VAELQRRGLNDQESFWLARRRVGQPKQLGEEFVKADPAKVWRERAFWIALGLLVTQLWVQITQTIWYVAILPTFKTYLGGHDHLLLDFVLFYTPFLTASDLENILRNPVSYPIFMLLPMIWLIVVLSRGRAGRTTSFIQILFRSRQRFVFIIAALFAAHYAWVLYSAFQKAEQLATRAPTLPRDEVFQRIFASSILPIALIVLIAWLMPVQNRKTYQQV
jgi:hypothetical protein